MKKCRMILVLSGFLMCAMSTACGSSGSSTPTPTPVTGFHVTGVVSNLTASISFARAAADAVNVTDVVAVSPTAQGVTCTVVPVDSAGAFDAELEPDNIWGMFFIDDTKTGSDMFVGEFENSTMHSLSPNKTDGTADLGGVTVDETQGTATAEATMSELIEDLGIDSTTAETIGGQDEVLSRYSNPDVDNDGAIDCVDSATNYMLNFHIRFNPLLGGVAAEVDNIVDSFFSDSTTTFSYSSTGVYAAYLNTFSSATSGTTTFVNTDVVLESGGSVAANTPISNVTPLAFGDYYSYGPNLGSTSNLPSGEIIFAFGDRTLTYTNVATPTLEQLNAPTGRIFPFIKLIKNDSACTAGCIFSGIGYKWMKKAASGWAEATQEEITLLVDGVHGGTFSFYVDGDSGKYVTFNILPTAVSGTISWLPANANITGLTDAQFSAITVEQICHVGISYDDKLGMRYFENVNNSSDTCQS